MKNGLSVKEYAALHGMTEQAVYKRIRAGKLQTIEHQENGKKKLYILLDSSGTVPEPGTDDGSQDDRSHPGEAAADSAGQGAGSAPVAEIAALEKALEALTAQLAEKDKQIERLTELLYREQGLQQQSHMLLNAAAPARTTDLIQDDAAAAGDGLPDPGRQEPKAEQPKEKKKRSFWNWLFD